MIPMNKSYEQAYTDLQRAALVFEGADRAQDKEAEAIVLNAMDVLTSKEKLRYFLDMVDAVIPGLIISEESKPTAIVTLGLIAEFIDVDNALKSVDDLNRDALNDGDKFSKEDLQLNRDFAYGRMNAALLANSLGEYWKDRL